MPDTLSCPSCGTTILVDHAVELAEAQARVFPDASNSGGTEPIVCPNAACRAELELRRDERGLRLTLV